MRRLRVESARVSCCSADAAARPHSPRPLTRARVRGRLSPQRLQLRRPSERFQEIKLEERMGLVKVAVVKAFFGVPYSSQGLERAIDFSKVDEWGTSLRLSARARVRPPTHAHRLTRRAAQRLATLLERLSRYYRLGARDGLSGWPADVAHGRAIHPHPGVSQSVLYGLQRRARARRPPSQRL